MPADTSDDSPAQFSAARDTHVHNGNFAHAPNGTINFFGANGGTEIPEALQSHSAPDALHTSTAVSRQNLCTPGTRTVTLSHLQSLAASSDPDSPDVVWMYGPAGAGKSAIMRTFAKSLEKDGRLLASFFFFRSESQRNTSTPFIPTLASQACDVLPATRPHISSAIRNNRYLFSQPAHRQSPHLLREPLLSALASPEVQDRWTRDAPMTVIIDGLDECTDQDGQTEIIEAVAGLAASIRSHPDRRIKIFVASRPEHQIKTAFESNKDVTIVRLDNSDANIHLFYDEQLDKIRKKFSLPSSWPSTEEIEWLTDKSSGQYSFAGISTRFMLGGDPRHRLKIMREALQDDALRPFNPLDQLYATVFNQLPSEMRTPALLVLRCRLQPWWKSDYNVVLEPLLQLPSGYIQGLAPYLSSLIDFDNELKSYHASLADFLVDALRSGPFSLHVDDRMLAHTIQKGIIVIFTKPSSECLDMHHIIIFFLIVGEALENSWMMTHYPLPNDELDLLLREVHPDRLATGELSLILFFFIILLQRQFQSRHIRVYTTNPVLWYAIWIRLPRQLRLGWERRTRAYSSIAQDRVDLAFGFALCGVDLTPSGLEIGDSDRGDSTLFLRIDEKLPVVDSSQGWHLAVRDRMQSTLRSMALAIHLGLANPLRLWQCLEAVLLFVSAWDRRQLDHVQRGVRNFLHSCHSHKESDFDPSSCKKCLDIAHGIDYPLSQGLDGVWGFFLAGSSKALSAAYHFMRGNKRCWDSEVLVSAFASLTKGYSTLPKPPYIPTFVHTLRNRELRKITQAFQTRCQEPDRKCYGWDHGWPRFFADMQIRNYQIYRDITIIVTSSLAACLCILYIVFYLLVKQF